MRFLLDASADFRLGEYLAALGHDVATIAHDFPQELEDAEVLAIAVKEKRILIANDRDFGELIFRHNLPHTGVIYFRLEETKLAFKIQRLDRVLSRHSHQLSQFIVVSEQGIRVRRSTR